MSVLVACPRCGFPLAKKYEDILAVLKRRRKGGWNISDLARELDVVIPLVFLRVKQMEAAGLVRTRLVIGRESRQRIVEAIKK